MPIGDQKSAVLACGCCGASCVGVCFPFSDNALQPLDWEIDAPNCAGIDGSTGIFNPIDPQFQTEGACGHCTCYQNISEPASIPGQFKEFLSSPIPDCYDSPCSIPMCFALTSDPLEEPVSAPGVAGCCGRLRLLVGVSGGNLSLGGEPAIETGCDADTPSAPCNDFETWVELEPISCVCDPITGLAAVFSLAALAIVCGQTYADGECIGEPTCCLPFACDFDGATVSVAVRP